MSETKMIGKKIADVRKKTNISQAQLAERLFISPQAVGKWERGESMPDIITLNHLAEILGVDLNYFSENFRSVASELSSNGTQPPSVKHSESSQEKKLSWDMSSGNWIGADFSGLKNLNEKFSSSNMQRCKFIGSNLSGLQLKNNNVDNCDFSGSDLSNSHIRNSNLGNNIFKDCLLKEAEVGGSNVERCDFSGADLTGTEFIRSNISGCDFTRVDFTGVVIKSGGFSGVAVKSGESGKNKLADAVWNHTSFVDSQIIDMVFEGIMEDCYFENCGFTRVTFQDTTLKNTFFKNNKNLKKVRFSNCRADRMTYEFLKQGKADLSGITLHTPKGENE